MDTESISEPMFLLTELRYTLGQLHVQLGGLSTDEKSGTGGQRTLDDILRDMASTEDRYQAEYAQILNLPTSEAGKEEDTIPLPINEAEQVPQHQAHLERERAHTIAILERATEPWPTDLLEKVKGQVAQDRAFTTEIAEWRKAQFETPDRGDLDKPLTRPDDSAESSA